MAKRKTKYIDINGKQIKNLKSWKLKNPDGVYFDSEFEYKAFKLFEEAGLNVEFHPESRILQPRFECFALNSKCKLYKSTIRPITYTPDFKITCDNGSIIFIETKGYFREGSRMRVKLFQYSLEPNEFLFIAHDKYYSKKGVDRMKEVKAIINIIETEFSTKKKIAKTTII